MDTPLLQINLESVDSQLSENHFDDSTLLPRNMLAQRDRRVAYSRGLSVCHCEKSSLLLELSIHCQRWRQPVHE